MSSWPRQRRSHRASHAIAASILVAHAQILAQHFYAEQPLDVSIVPVLGSFLPSSTAVASWVTDGEMALRFGMNVSSEGRCLTPCAGCVLLITFKKCAGQPYIRTPYSVLHTDRPRISEYDILSAEEETPEKLGARLFISFRAAWAIIL